MRHVKQAHLTDRTTTDRFQFSLRCHVCEKEWNSTPILRRTQRAGEKKLAWSKAAKEACGAFNYCPICHQLVCDYCFLICDELDLCVSCAQKLQKHGEAVLQYE